MVADPAIAVIRAIVDMSLHEELIVVADILAAVGPMEHRMVEVGVRADMVVVMVEGTVS